MTSWALVIALMASLDLSWRAARTNPLTSESSEIEFVRRWRPESRPLTVRLPPVRRVATEAALRSSYLRSSVRARDLPNERPLLVLTRMPMGDYRLVIEQGASRLAGTLIACAGTTSQPLEQWSLDGLEAGQTPLMLRLPAGVRSVTIRGDAAAQAGITRLALRPERVETTARLTGRYALRAARYGRVQAFFLDDALLMEPRGVWTRGGAGGEVMVRTDGGDEELIELDVTAGPVPVTVTLTAAAATQTLALEAGERRRVRLPGGLWEVETSGMFRPKDFDVSNQDARPLGAHLEFRQ